ncbi:hypothetical protein [Actinophytocola sp. KF-1]
MGDVVYRAAGWDGPPAPDGVSTLDELCARLRDLRAWAGNPSFTRLVQAVTAVRAARGVPAGECRPGRVTVYECFRPGRTRIDVELLVDIVAALGVGEAGRARWRRAHQAASTPAAREVAAVRPGSQARTVEALLAALRTSSARRVVNLAGPVGTGKSTLLARLPVTATRAGLATGDRVAALERAFAGGPAYVLVDDADSPAALAALCAALDRYRTGRVVVASRRPLPGWPHTPAALLPEIAVVPVLPWADDEVDALARRCGITHAAQRAAVVALAGGVPLLADRMCRAVHRGAPADVPGALADLAVTEVVTRLRREETEPADLGALTLLASCGQADQEVLPGAVFEGLAAVSLVHAAEEGLAVREPYRTLFDHVHSWRQPLRHRRSVARALDHNGKVLAGSADDVRRARRTEQALWLTGDPTIRDALFPARGERIVVRESSASDTDDVLRLLHHWARRADLDVRRSERVLTPLVASRPDGFRIATGADGDVLGAITSIPLASPTHHLVEPLLERHAPDVAGSGGVFVGMAIARDGTSEAALLRDVLLHGIGAGQVVVATQWPAYQRLVRRLGFTFVGQTREDVFRCGRQVQIHTLRLAPAALVPWLNRLTRHGVPVGDRRGRAWLADQLGRVYRAWHTPALLTTSPLLAHPDTPTVPALRAALAALAEELAASADPDRSAAGRLLLDRYLTRGGRTDARPDAGLRRALVLVAEMFWPAHPPR